MLPGMPKVRTHELEVALVDQCGRINPAAHATPLLAGECWQLSAPGLSCAALCGTGSAVSAEATVRGSGEPAIQRGLVEREGLEYAPPANSTTSCGVDDWRFPYGGMALLDVFIRRMRLSGNTTCELDDTDLKVAWEKELGNVIAVRRVRISEK